MEYEVKWKRQDTGKWWGAGKVSQGQYGPRIGMRKTPELMAYINSVTDGGYINFALFEPREKKEPERQLDEPEPIEGFGNPEDFGNAPF